MEIFLKNKRHASLVRLKNSFNFNGHLDSWGREPENKNGFFPSGQDKFLFQINPADSLAH
jgi:hypothetical protein